MFVRVCRRIRAMTTRHPGKDMQLERSRDLASLTLIDSRTLPVRHAYTRVRAGCTWTVHMLCECVVVQLFGVCPGRGADLRVT